MSLHNQLIYIIFLSLFLGFFVLKQNYKSKQNLTFTIICFGIAMWVSGIYLLQEFHSFYWPDKLSLFGGILMVGGFYAFSRVFPTERSLNFGLKRPFSESLLFRTLPLIALVFILPFNLVIKGIVLIDGSFSPVNGPLYPLYAFVCGFYMLATVYNFIVQYKNNIGYKRQKMVYVALGLVFFLLTALICDVILPAFGIAIWKFVGPLSSIVFLALSSWTLVSYNLMDIRLVLKGGIVNVLSLVVVIFLMSGLQKLIPLPTTFPSQIFTIMFFSALFFFIMIRAGINFIFSKILLRKYYLFKDSFNELNIFLHEGLSVERIIFTSNKYLKQGLRLAWIYYFDTQGQKIVSAPYKSPIEEGKISLDQIFDEQLNIYVKTLHAPQFFYGAELEAFPKASNAPIAILPLWNKEELQGYFVLGPQLGLNGLSYEEIQQVHHAWAHMETAFDRALLYEDLEQQVKAQVKDVTYKNKKLKELVKNRLDFIQLTSHQLRTPITSLSGALQLLLQDGINVQDRDEMTRLAYDKSKELTSIVNGVLKLARLEKGEDPKDTSNFVNLNEVFAPLLPVIEASARAKNLSVEFEPIAKAIVIGNRLYLEQAFYNLLENAVNHTEQGGIKISFEEKDGFITIAISDTGSGIPDELKERIFSRGALGSESKGTGLGLYIAKTVVDAHPEGKIWFESDADGTTFLVSLKKFYQD